MISFSSTCSLYSTMFNGCSQYVVVPHRSTSLPNSQIPLRLPFPEAGLQALYWWSSHASAPASSARPSPYGALLTSNWSLCICKTRGHVNRRWLNGFQVEHIASFFCFCYCVRIFMLCFSSKQPRFFLVSCLRVVFREKVKNTTSSRIYREWITMI